MFIGVPPCGALGRKPAARKSGSHSAHVGVFPRLVKEMTSSFRARAQQGCSLLPSPRGRGWRGMSAANAEPSEGRRTGGLPAALPLIRRAADAARHLLPRGEKEKSVRNPHGAPGRTFGAPEGQLREMRIYPHRRRRPGLRCAPSGLRLLEATHERQIASVGRSPASQQNGLRKPEPISGPPRRASREDRSKPVIRDVVRSTSRADAPLSATDGN